MQTTETYTWSVFGRSPNQIFTLSTPLGSGTVVTSPERVSWVTADDAGDTDGPEAITKAKAEIERRLLPRDVEVGGLADPGLLGGEDPEPAAVAPTRTHARPAELPSAPAEARDLLAARAERVEGFAVAVLELALAEEVDAELVEQLRREATENARDLVEAGAKAIAEIEREYLAPRRGLVDYHQNALEKAVEREEEAVAWIERIKRDVLRVACEAGGVGKTQRIDTPTAKVWIHKNPPAVELDPAIPDLADLLPDDLVRVKREPDRVAILAALEAKRPVPGARRVQRDRVEVK